MKKIMLLVFVLMSAMLLSAQGVYQLWGMTQAGGKDNIGTIFSTDAAGDNFNLRYQFNTINPGANPQYTDLIEYQDKFYGMTQHGGIYGKGVIFEWDPGTNVYTKKIDFDGINGRGPLGSLTLSNGKFFGMTEMGGTSNQGVIFEWDPATNVYTKKISFESAKGANPTGSLTLSNGKFYGMTRKGGGPGGAGVIFEWDPATNLYTKKIQFNGSNGAAPTANLTLWGEKFYGMTERGGSNGSGVIFEWDPMTNEYIKRIEFDGTNGNQPVGSLKLSGDKFYGMTPGVIFEWDPATNVYTKKIDFNCINGCYPKGDLMLKDGKFYGMTEQGGSNNKGVIFEWDPTTNVFIHKIDFDVSNGCSPQGSLTLKGGKIYGMTSKGGSTDLGVIFEWDPELNLFSKRIDWGSPNGSVPYGSLAWGYGKLYGMTNKGGSSDKGVIFEFDPAYNKYTKKVDFNGTNGSYPFGSLTMSLGKFYGMTSQINLSGNAEGDGVIFEWDPVSNIFVKKIDFTPSGGSWPFGSLALSEGKFYGTTTAGGNRGAGVIFEWDPLPNIYTPKIDLVNYGGYENGPYGGLTLNENKFYGTINGYGTKGEIDFGVIFEWDPASNVYTKKVDFDGYNGLYPTGGLTLFGGKFYGMTTSGGNDFYGVIFEWDPVTNVSTKKIDFNGINGIRPYGSLTLSGGKLYGMTSAGGNYGKGVIFEWDPLTNVYTKKKDFVGTDGANPTYTNNLTLVPAAVAKGLSGSCINFPSVTIDNSNNNQWVSIIDELGDAVAEIKANGNNLGIVNASMFINNGAVREDKSKRLYLDRNIAITPQVQPTSPVDIRLYIKGAEYEALKNAVNSNGQPPGISSINDIAIFKVGNDCGTTVADIINPIVTTVVNWEADYVFSASITSFSSFYFASKNPLECPPPIIKCNEDIVVNATAGTCGAAVYYKSPEITDICGNTTITQIAGLQSGKVFPVGCTINTFVATGSSGKKDTCSFKVTVKDIEPPHIAQVRTNPDKLWPPNHKMKAVTISYKTWDNCGAVTSSLSVSSNEPVNGTGHDDKAPDWIVLDDHHLKLRAERSGRGNGRIYIITITSTDASGNTSIEKTKVIVPHNNHEWHHNEGHNDDNDGYVDGDGDYHEHLFDCKVMPNPSKQYFNIQVTSASSEKIEAKLLDLNGKLISKLSTVKNQILRFGDDLRPGVYMVEITQGEQRKTIKVIKQ